MANPAPGFEKHPNHTVKITPSNGPVRITADGVTLGETSDALALAEANYPLAYYLPLEALPSGMLHPSDHTTYCPFKGTANYYHLMIDGQTHENAVWTYREPYDEALAIKGFIAIYPSAATVSPV